MYPPSLRWRRRDRLLCSTTRPLLLRPSPSPKPRLPGRRDGTREGDFEVELRAICWSERERRGSARAQRERPKRERTNRYPFEESQGWLLSSNVLAGAEST